MKWLRIALVLVLLKIPNLRPVAITLLFVPIFIIIYIYHLCKMDKGKSEAIQMSIHSCQFYTFKALNCTLQISECLTALCAIEQIVTSILENIVLYHII